MTSWAELQTELAYCREAYACVQRLGKSKDYQNFSDETKAVHCRTLARLQKQGEALKKQLEALEARP